MDNIEHEDPEKVIAILKGDDDVHQDQRKNQERHIYITRAGGSCRKRA